MVDLVKVELHLRLPREVKAKLVEYLIKQNSPNLVPQGAMSQFIAVAIENELARREAP